MDGQKFDKLARAFATGTDRRTLLKLLGGGTAIAVAGVTFARPSGVFAQSEGDACNTGTQSPCGDTSLVCCTPNEDDAPGSAGVCTSGMTGCQYPDPTPGEGDPCNTGEEFPCGDTTLVCCTSSTDDAPGTEGVCTSGMTGCQYPIDSSCISGTEDPCGDFNAEAGTDYICCTYGAAPGSEGTCMDESLCVSAPPNTGAGTSADSNSWIAPVAVAGAAAAVFAYKSRDNKVENEA